MVTDWISWMQLDRIFGSLTSACFKQIQNIVILLLKNVIVLASYKAINLIIRS